MTFEIFLVDSFYFILFVWKHSNTFDSFYFILFVLNHSSHWRPPLMAAILYMCQCNIYFILFTIFIISSSYDVRNFFSWLILFHFICFEALESLTTTDGPIEETISNHKADQRVGKEYSKQTRCFHFVLPSRVNVCVSRSLSGFVYVEWRTYVRLLNLRIATRKCEP